MSKDKKACPVCNEMDGATVALEKANDQLEKTTAELDKLLQTIADGKARLTEQRIGQGRATALPVTIPEPDTDEYIDDGEDDDTP